MGERIRFCSLASSSTHGNAYLVEALGDAGEPRARILVDCGLPLRRLEAALAGLGVHPRTLDGVFLTHEHQDHIAALRLRLPFPQRHGVPVYATAAGWQALHGRIGPLDARLRRVVEPSGAVPVGPMTVRALPKRHDAADPVGFLLSTAGERLAVLTDLGTVGGDLFEAVRGAEYLIFESNHDVGMQWASGRPLELKRRVLSDAGHLSNDQAAAALAHLATGATRVILLAHLSEECNRPDLARRAVASRLAGGAFRGTLDVAPPGAPSARFG